MNLIITALILFGYEINIFFNLKPLFGYKKHEYKKPFDCFFCLSVWANTIGIIIYSITTRSLDYNQFCIYGFSILITKIIDLLWNKN